MFKLLSILFRGKAARMTENLADQNALLILEQQIRDAANAAGQAKRALAIAMAQDNSERSRLDSLKIRIADLETRALAALAAGNEALAQEAADSIAELETDRDAAQLSCDRFAKESARLKQIMRANDRRLSELERGRRAAQAEEAVARLRSSSVSAANAPGSLREAEATLARLRQRQSEEAFADASLQDLDYAQAPHSVSEKLEAAGFGPQTRPTGASVLERLRKSASAA